MTRTRRTIALLTILGVQAGVGTAGAQIRKSMPSPTVRFPADEARLALRAAGGRSVVSAYIGEAGPYDFFIDTGAGVSVIDADLAARLGLEVAGRTATRVPGGPQVDADVIRAPAIRVGQLEIQGSTPIALRLAEMTGGLFVGVLGMDVFRSVLLTLDPAGGQAVVSRGHLSPESKNVLRLDGSRGRIAFNIEVAGRTVPIELDTGSPSAFTFPIELIDQLPALDVPEGRATAGLVGGSREVRIRQLNDAIRFAGLTFENPTIGFMSPSPPTGNIGSQVLDRLVIGIDQANGLIAFTPSDRPVPSAGPRRLGLRLGGPGPSPFASVASVDPGGLAQQAGLRAGDSIVTLNGRPMAAYDRASLGALFRGAEPLTFEINRGGTPLVIRIR